MVEQHNPEVLLELRRYEPPHVLIAAETMGEDHGPVAGTMKVHVVPFDYAHDGSLRGTSAVHIEERSPEIATDTSTFSRARDFEERDLG
jgi:hypothetical protein